MTTVTRPDADAIEHLDFTVRCDVSCWLQNGGLLQLVEHCGRKAVWVATLSCCGHQVFHCHPHATSPWPHKCAGCGFVHEGRAGWRWEML